MEFGSIMSGLSAAGAVVAVLAGGKVRILLGFASFVARRVGRFFDKEDASQLAHEERRLRAWENSPHMRDRE